RTRRRFRRSGAGGDAARFPRVAPERREERRRAMAGGDAFDDGRRGGARQEEERQVTRPAAARPSRMKPTFALDAAGYFTRGGERIVPVGVNYWPASCGVEMWRAWPATEIQRDLEITRTLGLNC